MTTRDLLSAHKTVAQLKGIEKKPCFFRTSLCPNQCGHGGDVAIFVIKKYLFYEKPGQYGDKQAQLYHVKSSESVERTGLTPEKKDIFDSLVPGDFVLLSWNHDYVHTQGCSAPQRPITELIKITEEEANKHTS